jgi:hypothetical protein
MFTVIFVNSAIACRLQPLMGIVQNLDFCSKMQIETATTPIKTSVVAVMIYK